jgi:hypothetical protein
LTVNIDRIESGDEVNENIVDALWNLLQESGSNLSIRWVFTEIYWDEELLSLLVNIADIDTTLVREENPVTLLMDELV